MAFDTDGLTMGVGTSSAHCLTFDLRSSRPTFVKEHQYGLPITGIKFHQVCKVQQVFDRQVICDAYQTVTSDFVELACRFMAVNMLMPSNQRQAKLQ